MKSTGGAKNMVVMGRQGTFGASDTSELHLWVGVIKTTGQMAFYLKDAKGNEPSPDGMISGGFVTDGNWHYIVAVRDGVSKRNYLYVDGAEVAVSEAYTYLNSFGTGGAVLDLFCTRDMLYNPFPQLYVGGGTKHPGGHVWAEPGKIIFEYFIVFLVAMS